MNFYDREKEISRLREIEQTSRSNAQLSVVTGRRRIGKTLLLLRATKSEAEPVLYFFVARKAENFLCQDFQQEIAVKLGIPIMGEVSNFGKLFEYLMILSERRAFTLIIDEFQEFFKVAPSAYSDMQHYWDIYKEKSKINIIVCGSVYSLMHKIFENQKEPLFSRATAKMSVKPFEVSILKEILNDYNPKYTPEDLLALYSFTGGVAKYVQLFMDAGATTYKKMLSLMIQEDSTFLGEGRNMLIEEFGTEYATYFTILSAIARGETTRSKIEAVVKRELGGYYDGLKTIIDRDYKTFSGKMLEKYFRTKFIQSGNITNIGGYWDRKGENEIDLIVVNELDKQAQIIEVKRKAENIDMDVLRDKGVHFLHATGELKKYRIIYSGLSMEDM